MTSSVQSRNTFLATQGSGYTPGTPKRLTGDRTDRDKKKDGRSNLFDWSEQQPIDKTPGDHSPPQPKTVHAKKDADGREAVNLQDDAFLTVYRSVVRAFLSCLMWLASVKP